jgi:hypothetical protein
VLAQHKPLGDLRVAQSLHDELEQPGLVPGQSGVIEVGLVAGDQEPDREPVSRPQRPDPGLVLNAAAAAA